MSSIRSLRLAFAIAMLTAGAGCAHWHRSSSMPSSPIQASPPRPADAPSDANIAAILLAANNTDISYAKLAPTRARSAAVKDFASRMLADHTGVNKLVNDVLASTGITPEDDIASLDFRDESSAKRDILRELEGHAFDSTYMDNEVTYHTKLLAALDNVLIPDARNAQMKQLLGNIRPAVAAHLAHAQQVRAGLMPGRH
jgi:putative membrane protein